MSSFSSVDALLSERRAVSGLVASLADYHLVAPVWLVALVSWLPRLPTCLLVLLGSQIFCLLAASGFVCFYLSCDLVLMVLPLSHRSRPRRAEFFTNGFSLLAPHCTAGYAAGWLWLQSGPRERHDRAEQRLPRPRVQVSLLLQSGTVRPSSVFVFFGLDRQPLSIRSVRFVRSLCVSLSLCGRYYQHPIACDFCLQSLV